VHPDEFPLLVGSSEAVEIRKFSVAGIGMLLPFGHLDNRMDIHKTFINQALAKRVIRMV
jgi:hypothetical protein